MPFAETPAVEDQIVLRHLRQGVIKCAPGRRRQNHIIECPARHDRLDRAAAVQAEQTGEWDRCHGSTVPPVPGRNQFDPPLIRLGCAAMAHGGRREHLLNDFDCWLTMLGCLPVSRNFENTGARYRETP